MTLEEMLALLPDNDTGAIGADDLRAIVTELHTLATVTSLNSVAQVFGYQYATGTGNPVAGRISMNAAWNQSPTILRVNETTDDGQGMVFGVFDHFLPKVILVGANGGVLRLTVTGASVDQGTYRDIPVTVTEFTGLAPINNEKMAVVLRVELAA